MNPMKFRLCTALAAVVSLCGCISHHATDYREAPRTKVEFESEKAGRVFYEALSKFNYHSSNESETRLSIPIIFEHTHSVKTGDDEKFNEGIRRCDSNQDGKITEKEADIFASQKK
jgi:hypothetical protein